MRPTRCWAARSGRAAAARRRSAARAPAPRAAGEGTGTCPEPKAWSRRELPLTRHNYVDINALCQSHYRRGPADRMEAESDGKKAGNRLGSVSVLGQILLTARLTPFIPAKAGIQDRSWVPATGSPRRERRGVPLAGTSGKRVS